MAVNKKKAVVLLSGGLDSATALAVALKEGYSCYSLSFLYGQRHRLELNAAERVAKAMGVERHMVLDIGLGCLGGSALTDRIEVPKYEEMRTLPEGIPSTYVPARNTVFLAYALAWAEVLRAPDIFIGVNAVDYSGYPDCRPEYIGAFESMANLAIKAAVEGSLLIRIHTPLMHLTKAEIIRTGSELGVDYSLTHSCYDPQPNGLACGQCASCRLRLKGFQEAGLIDPIPYANPRPPSAGRR